MLEQVFVKLDLERTAGRRHKILQRAAPGRTDPETHFRIMLAAEQHVAKHGRQASCLDVCGERGDLYWVIKTYARHFQLQN